MGELEIRIIIGGEKKKERVPSIFHDDIGHYTIW